MKRFLCAAALLVLVTGCGTNNAANDSSSNTATNGPGTTSNQTAVGGTNTTDTSGTSGATGGSGNTTGASTTTPAAQSQDLNNYAKGIMDMYVRTKNAKTLQEYQVMANQIFIPGMANVVGSMAQSGTDYNHPMKTYSIHVNSVNTVNQQAFMAVVAVHMQFKDGTKEDHTYHVRFLQGGQLDYMIQTIS